MHFQANFSPAFFIWQTTGYRLYQTTSYRLYLEEDFQGGFYEFLV